MSKTYYRITDQGIKRIVEDEADIEADPEIFKRMFSANATKLANLFNAGLISSRLTGNVGVAVKLNSTVFTIPLAIFPLKARFIMEGKLLVPSFNSPGEVEVMELAWTPPPSMRVFWMVCMLPGEICANNQIICAMDKAGRTWRLPTSNVYENGNLCCGKYDGKGYSYLEAIIKAWRQFENSEWQADLSDRGGSQGVVNGRKMFRFKLLETEGAEQQEPQIEGGDWTKLCTRLASDFITENIVT